MSGQLLLQGGRVIAADGEYGADVLIEGEKISAVGAIDAPAPTAVDVSGCLVMPGLIDYHEQHRYAYELLGLEDKRAVELGAAARGTSASALTEYVEGIAAVLVHARKSLRARAPVVIVVHDRRELFPRILELAGLRLEDRARRHVNRRTGRRAGEFFEDILMAR